MAQDEVIVIGAGLAGLACALRLQERGISCQLLEASDRAGGRVQTDVVDGFRLDRGFQVLLTAYPVTQRVVDYEALNLGAFAAGAVVRRRGRFYRFVDPVRNPADALPALLANVGSTLDKARILKLRSRVCGPALEEVLQHPEVRTIDRLKELGFSARMTDHFFRPFLGGIFLERELTTSSRKFEFVFRMFSLGKAALPANGMGAIPGQLAERLGPGVLRTGARVKSCEADVVELESGERIRAQKVVIATEEPEAKRLLRGSAAAAQAAVTCVYYAAERSPVDGPWLVLNGDGTGPINNLCVPTEVQRSYGPEGKALVSVTVLGTGADESAVRAQLVEWHGAEAESWRHLRTYEVREALPLQEPPALFSIEKVTKASDRMFLCGDYMGIASIEGAIASGLRAAEAAAG